jgi:hypothetical protein
MVDSIWTQPTDICTDQLRIGPGEGLVRRRRSVVRAQPVIEINRRGATVGRNYSVERRCRTSDGIGVVSDCRRRRACGLRLKVEVAGVIAVACTVTSLHIPIELMPGCETRNYNGSYISNGRIIINERIRRKIAHIEAVIRGTT